MAISKYKSLDEFSFEGVEYGRGDTLILDNKDAKKLVGAGKIQLTRDLDPKNEKDAKEIAFFENNPTGAAKPEAPALSKSEHRRIAAHKKTDEVKEPGEEAPRETSTTARVVRKTAKKTAKRK